MAETEKIRLSELDKDHPEIVEKVYRLLLEYSRYIVRHYPLDESAAEDCAQTVIFKLLAMSAEHRESIQYPPSYLRSAARNAIIDRLKQEIPSRQSSLDDTTAVYELPDPSREDKAHESGIMLSKAWNLLDTDEEKRLMKMYLLGYKDREIAKVLGTDVRDIRSKHAHLMYKLKKIIRKLPPGEK
jgi:RNA polymerase sigma factor (sigma-70 family)